MAIPNDIVQPLKTNLEKAQEVLVLLPLNAGQEMVAAALGLYQSLSENGKSVVIACPSKISASSRALPGGQDIAEKIGNRNLVISLKVNERDSIDKVSYNLDEETKVFNLIIQPKKGYPPLKRDDVNYSYSGASADLIFLVGANRLEDLGYFYEDERKLFADAKTVSLHRFPAQAFTDYQVIDDTTSGFGELAYELVQELNLNLTADAASDFLVGIDLATNNLQNGNLKPDTLEHMAQLLRAGGRRGMDTATQPAPQFQSQPMQPVMNQPMDYNQPVPASNAAVAPTPVTPQPASSSEVPDEWLAPKIYKGSKQGNQ